MSNEDEPKWPSISSRPEMDEQQNERPNFWPFTSDADVNDEDIEKSVPLLVEKATDEQVVYGIVYEPDTVDAQGDFAKAEEIEAAAHDFMQNSPVIKVMHKGKAANVKILESYITPQDVTIANRKVKKGSWVICVKVLDKDLWQAVKDGELTGFSMAGNARTS